jgi:phosphoglycolate phosphatase
MKEDRRDGSIRAVIFDFDGTLTEMTLDIPGTIDEIKKVALKYANEAVVCSINEGLISETIYAIEAVCNDPVAFRKEALGKLSEAELSFPAGKGVFPYTREALATLRKKGFRLGILTRSCVDALNVVFPDAREYVDAMATREWVKFVKPHPGHMEKMLEMLDVTAGESIYVGDQTTDVRTGQLFNMKTVGVLCGKATLAELESVGTSHIIADVSELPALLESLSSSTATE